ncbi:flagellar basal body P-ring formation chaperone FlgA [Rubinisphaera sp.]|uniref:flagellar basal body P-ring formation chaperone FlgA n=1 Tax=Rubinisphaera sp. TaxID=2024857 RepID=UPI000C0DBBD7|nr:flagellar basal body P-ring formation chaperone FlgA [Rubinisphaera sp.]MBV10618.1 flagella basal body P-ring formation protein FlgA [Rubinisphaera sp.]HCS52339.1 flagella basal body P-ring formation protein FlgA [Planctomycetaceae bacterium]
MKSLMAIVIFTLLTTPVFAATIRLLPDVQMQGSLVRLGDIAEITDCDATIRNHLEELTIGPAPAPGREFRIPLDTVRRELALRGVDQTDLRFTGATESVVTQGRTKAVDKPVSPMANRQLVEHVEASIRTYLTQRVTELGTIDVTLEESSASLLPAELPQRMPVTIQGGQQPWTGIQHLTVSFTSTEGAPHSFPVTCHISQKPRLLALKHGLPRGQVIREIDLIWIEAETATEGFSDPVAVIGTETAKNVRALAAIQADDIRMLPLVRRNDIVAVTAQIGSISVMRYCKCYEEGTLGQFVTLSPLDSKERIVARVSGYRAAVISMNDQNVNQTTPQTQAKNLTSVKSSGLELIATETPSQPIPTANAIRQTSAQTQMTPKQYSSPTPPRVLANQPAQLP